MIYMRVMLVFILKVHKYQTIIKLHQIPSHVRNLSVCGYKRAISCSNISKTAVCLFCCAELSYDSVEKDCVTD